MKNIVIALAILLSALGVMFTSGIEEASAVTPQCCMMNYGLNWQAGDWDTVWKYETPYADAGDNFFASQSYPASYDGEPGGTCRHRIMLRVSGAPDVPQDSGHLLDPGKGWTYAQIGHFQYTYNGYPITRFDHQIYCGESYNGYVYFGTQIHG